jgi:hypothetical protein
MVARKGKIVAGSFRAKVAAGISSSQMQFSVFTTNLSSPVYSKTWPAPITTGTILTDEFINGNYVFDPAFPNKFIHAVAASGPPPGDLTDVLICIWVEYDP